MCSSDLTTAATDGYPGNKRANIDCKGKSSSTSTTKAKQNRTPSPEIADLAYGELSEMLRRCNLQSNNSSSNENRKNNASLCRSSDSTRERFPVACKLLLHEIDGNRNCVDCNARDPEWAAVSYGALVCIKCSGRHRSMGVAVSQVRSVDMDHWTYEEIVLMLEGGNSQLSNFFERHALTKTEFDKQQKKILMQQSNKPESLTSSRTSLTSENVTTIRYKTKAGLFYKNQLYAHVQRLLGDQQKPYKGRPLRRKSSSKAPKSRGGLTRSSSGNADSIVRRRSGRGSSPSSSSTDEFRNNSRSPSGPSSPRSRSVG